MRCANPAHPRVASRAVPRPERRFLVGTWSDGEFVLLEAELVGLSGDGVHALVRGAVEAGQPVWLRLQGSEGSRGAPATVLSTTWLRGGRCAVRLALDEACPAGFIEALVARLAEPAVRPPRVERSPHARI